MTQETVILQENGQVFLPIAWLEKYGLREGDVVAFEETEHGLLISPREALVRHLLEEIREELYAQGVSLEDLMESGRAIKAQLLKELSLVSGESYENVMQEPEAEREIVIAYETDEYAADELETVAEYETDEYTEDELEADVEAESDEYAEGRLEAVVEGESDEYAEDELETVVEDESDGYAEGELETVVEDEVVEVVVEDDESDQNEYAGGIG